MSDITVRVVNIFDVWIMSDLFFCHRMILSHLKINHLLMIVPSYLWHSWQNHTTLVTCRRSYTNISYFVAICWVSTYTKSGFHIYMYGSDRSIYRLIPVTVTFGGTCSNCMKNNIHVMKLLKYYQDICATSWWHFVIISSWW